MVKKTFFISLSAFFLSLTSAVFLVAGEFTASVSRTQVDLSESFTLNLTLKDISPKEAPGVSALKTDFLIHSQQHSTNTAIVNGKVSSSITWKISLTPKTEGVLQIPPITVDTADGLLSTQPIPLNVIKGSNAQSGADSAGLNIIAKAGNPSPYKNEPLIYTVILTSKMPLYNVQTQKMHMEDAIVELLEEPKLEQRVIEGVQLHVVELNYLITPLKTGPLTIPSLTVQGAIPQKRKEQYSSFFNDDLDPFAIMQGFDRLKPFTLTAQEIPLDVQPPLSEMSPWLPAKALTLEEQWPSDQAPRVGEPFSRSFQIKAEGLKASQLPHLEDLHNQSSTFKAYADKPEEQEKVFQGAIHSMRKEQYTLIPQQAGTWVLPEISISWWDSVKKEKRTSSIPARTVQILPALETATSVPLETAFTTTAAAEAPPLSARPPLLLYGIMGMLTFFLTAALLWVFTLQRKIASLTKGPTQKPIKPPAAKPKKTIAPPVAAVQKEKKEKLPDLNPT
jgi:hypothetical protein